MERVRIKPRDGLVVRMEDGAALPEAGAAFALTMFVRRRIADGDVVVVADEEDAA